MIHIAFWAHATPFDGETTSMRSYGGSRYLAWHIVNGNTRMTLTTTTLDVPNFCIIHISGQEQILLKKIQQY